MGINTISNSNHSAECDKNRDIPQSTKGEQVSGIMEDISFHIDTEKFKTLANSQENSHSASPLLDRDLNYLSKI